MTNLLRRRAVLLGWLVAMAWPTLAQDAPRQPVGDELYKTYAALYNYDAQAPLNAEIAKEEDQGGTKVQLIKYDSTNGERVPGYLLVPPSAKKRPVLLVVHGYGMSKESILPAAPMLATFGVEYAFFCIDLQYHGERAKPGKEFLSRDLAASQKAYIQSVQDLRRALDYIATREDLDAKRVGVAGMSLGALVGSALLAVEPTRIKTAVLAVGGADWPLLFKDSQHEAVMALRRADPPLDDATVRKYCDPVDPLNFASHWGERAILLVNAKDDQVIPKSAAERLHAVAVGKPLVKEWYDGGHQLPPDVVLPRLLGWFGEHL
ncbi:MAG: alpha/beta fold hydrolase [Armatimonadetes bacterium]|nr:alpha/beta fold hydrolase [Armatimonadota bacterium]